MSSESDTPAAPSTIQLTVHHDRSLYMRIIHIITRSIRSQLVRPKKHQPKGSITLKPQDGAGRKCNISHRTVCDIHVYDMKAKKSTAKDVKKHIYYFGGGGWQSPPSSQHWQLCAKLATEVPDTTVSLVSYPLAPNNAAPTAFPWLLRFYREVLKDAEKAGEKVILAGDSSGGNIVLAVTLEAVREDAKSEHEGESPAQPVAVFAICPSTDLTRSNPAIHKLAKHDPLLTPPFVTSTANAWRADWDPTDRRVSPVNADISLLAKSGIHFHGITGGYDILSPDGIIFRDKLVEEGVTGQWLQWEQQMHCFVLTQGYGVPEAKKAAAWMVDVLKQE